MRADSRTGRLVRRTVIAPTPVVPQPVASKLIAPREVNGQPAAADPHVAAINEIVEEAARANSVDPLLVHSVIRVESNYDPFAVSPKGAAGLMQLIPATARRFGAANSFDVRENITAGVKYLKYLQDLFGDDRLALAAYNAGEGAVQRYRDIPPYRETEQYVYRVGKHYGEARKGRQPQPAAVQQTAAQPAQPQPEPLRQLEVATDADGRLILKTR
ncbi:MAG: lytic transglycosylase domain-containing protein [Acidobacteria bacterium]|nr:lytic transglycosylase domain-containing protein [Acidobacteriota bacterium]